MCTTHEQLLSVQRSAGVNSFYSIQVNLTGVPAIVVGLIVGNINGTAGSQ